MSILEPDTIDPGDGDALAQVIATAAANGCSRSAQFLLTHHPKLRREWTGAAELEAALTALLGRVAVGIERSGLSALDQQRVVRSIQANGAGVAELPEGTDA